MPLKIFVSHNGVGTGNPPLSLRRRSSRTPKSNHRRRWHEEKRGLYVPGGQAEGFRKPNLKTWVYPNRNLIYIFSNRFLIAASSKPFVTTRTSWIRLRTSTWPQPGTISAIVWSLNPHNTVHVRVGGTMATFNSCKRLPDRHTLVLKSPWSAFDPIFWLHHTQVDRVFLQVVQHSQSFLEWRQYVSKFNLSFFHPFLTIHQANLNTFWQTQQLYSLPESKKSTTWTTNTLLLLWSESLHNSFLSESPSLSASFKLLSPFPPFLPTQTPSQSWPSVSLPVNKIAADAEARQDVLAVSVERGLADWRVRISVKK